MIFQYILQGPDTLYLVVHWSPPSKWFATHVWNAHPQVTRTIQFTLGSVTSYTTHGALITRIIIDSAKLSDKEYTL